ncbi:GxxExxY protein [Rudanella paleaurantiibacter]|uniref:GxxExxY protein n=1 Tax=Rudanella paleaurantiibacter TaxID=2614655 RepID=A0A7J5U3K5_9BACT|nr:GxxExxY protein [Rudanella paleaurantiibacter]KAB7732082.1 GxxExxY protein [Rudanella paleaurantiibacter]
MHRENKRFAEGELSSIVIGRAIEVHRALGPGLLESAYQECLAYELKQAGLYVEREKALPIVYKDVKLEHGYRLDLLIEKQLVVELKTVEFLTDVHTAQILTYLRLGEFPLGLLINFHVKMLKEGIRRFAHTPLRIS